MKKLIIYAGLLGALFTTSAALAVDQTFTWDLKYTGVTINMSITPINPTVKVYFSYEGGTPPNCPDARTPLTPSIDNIPTIKGNSNGLLTTAVSVDENCFTDTQGLKGYLNADLSFKDATMQDGKTATSENALTWSLDSGAPKSSIAVTTYQQPGGYRLEKIGN